MNHILHTLPKAKHALRLAWVGLATAALTACGTVQPSGEASKSQEVIRTAVLDIAADAAVSDLERLYGGDVVVFRPEVGFAVMGFTAESLSSGLTLLAGRLEDNQDTFNAPVSALGAGTWGGGFSSWSGGFSSWSGGFSSWSGGEPTWEGDPQTYTPMDNLNLWRQIELPWAHQVADRLGDGVTVAVIDTGIDTEHPAFEGRLLPGKDFVGNDDDPQEEPGAAYGHGTGVAGVILQVAPRASILPIRVLDGDGFGDTDDIAQAIDWAVAQGADIINLSLGGREESNVLSKMIRYASTQEVVIVASGGNSGDELVTYPASLSATGTMWKFVIGVSSVDSADVKSLFSSFGARVLDIAAPGENVFTAVPDGRVGYWSGTSFAAPQVSGALALALAQPNLYEWPEDLGVDVTEHGKDDLYTILANMPYEDLLGVVRLDLRRFLEYVLVLN